MMTRTYHKSINHLLLLYASLLLKSSASKLQTCVNPTVPKNFETILSPICMGYKVDTKFLKGELTLNPLLKTTENMWNPKAPRTVKKIGINPKANLTLSFSNTFDINLIGSSELKATMTEQKAETQVRITDNSDRFINFTMINLVDSISLSKTEQNLILDNYVEIDWNTGREKIEVLTNFKTEECVGVPINWVTAKRYIESPCKISLGVFNNNTIIGETSNIDYFYEVEPKHIDIGYENYIEGYKQFSHAQFIRVVDDSTGNYRIKLVEDKPVRRYENYKTRIQIVREIKDIYTFNATSIDFLTANFQKSIADLYNHLAFMPMSSLHSIVQVPENIKNLEVYQKYGKKLFEVEKTVEKVGDKYDYAVDFNFHDLMNVQTSDTLAVGFGLIATVLTGEQNQQKYGWSNVLNLAMNSIGNSKAPNAYFTISTITGKLVYKSSILPGMNNPKWENCEFNIPKNVDQLIVTIFHAEKENNGNLGMLDIEKVIGLTEVSIDSDDTLIFSKYRIDHDNIFSEVRIFNSRDMMESSFAVVFDLKKAGFSGSKNIYYRLQYFDEKDSTVFVHASEKIIDAEKGYFEFEKVRHVNKPMGLVLMESSFLTKTLSRSVVVHEPGLTPVFPVSIVTETEILGEGTELGRVYSENYPESYLEKSKMKDYLVSVELDLEERLDSYFRISYGTTEVYKSEIVNNSKKFYFDPVKFSVPEFVENLTIKLMENNMMSDDEISVSDFELDCEPRSHSYVRYNRENCETDLFETSASKSKKQPNGSQKTKLGKMVIHSNPNEKLNKQIYIKPIFKIGESDSYDYKIYNNYKLKIKYGDTLLLDSRKRYPRNYLLNFSKIVDELEIEVYKTTRHWFGSSEELFGKCFVKTDQLSTDFGSSLNLKIRKIKDGKLAQDIGDLELLLN